MSPHASLTGQSFGDLTVVGECRDLRGRLKWKCRCRCGGSSEVYGNNLRSGGTTSCGCHRAVHPPGLSKTRVFTIWSGMMARCSNIDDPNYGGRGIAVCKRWQTFASFYRWAMRSGYQEHLTIERVNNDQGYRPGNCRWATPHEQARNTRRTVFVQHEGQRISLTDAAAALGLSYGRLQKRMKNEGMSFEEAVADVRAYRKPPPHLNFLGTRGGAA
jgi:hypothetical protein